MPNEPFKLSLLPSPTRSVMFYWFFWLVIVWFGSIVEFHIFGNNSVDKD